MTTQNLMQGGDTCRWDQAGSSRSERELVALHSGKDSVLEGLKLPFGELVTLTCH